MGQYKSAIWLILLIVYFFFLITITNSIDNAGFTTGNVTGINNTDTIIAGQSETTSYQCDTPRVAWSSSENTYTVNKKSKDCDKTLGAVSETTCNNIVGCTWGNTTSSFLFWSTTEEGCFGDVNISYYNNGSTEYSNICKLSDIDTADECTQFGCTYYEITTKPDNDIDSHKNILQTTGELFTFRYSFGFENESFNNLSTFVFFYIPFIMVLLTIYFLVPLIH